MDIRIATMADILSVSKIYADIQADKEWSENTGWTFSVYPTMLTARSAIDRRELYVGVEDGVIIGSMILSKGRPPEYKDGNWKYSADEEDIMTIHVLAVSPSVFRRGYGTKFMQFYEDFALKNGCHYLRFDASDKNMMAMAFFLKLGYSTAGEIDITFNNVLIHQRLFEKKI